MLLRGLGVGFDLFMGWDGSGLKGNERKGIGGWDIPHGEGMFTGN